MQLNPLLKVARRSVAIKDDARSLDNEIIEAFRERAESRGIGYQTAINEALRTALNDENVPLTVGKFREILRQELQHAG